MAEAGWEKLKGIILRETDLTVRDALFRALTSLEFLKIYITIESTVSQF